MIYVLCSLLFTHLTIAFVSVYLHRSLAHRAVTFHPVLAHVMRFYLWFTTGIVSTTWVAVHRKHHRYTDLPNDPHSPVQRGLLRVLFGGTFMYLKAGADPVSMQAYGRGCPRDWVEKNVYERFSYAGLPCCLALYCFVFGWIGAVMFLVNFLWIPFWGAGVVNGIGHMFGYRNFNTNDSSTNIFPIGLLMAGEELHNNHHNAPGSAKLSRRWFEFDAGWFWIRLFKALGLADVHTA